MSPGYNDFTLRRFGKRKGSKKTHKGVMSVGGHGDGVGVKIYFRHGKIITPKLLQAYDNILRDKKYQRKWPE